MIGGLDYEEKSMLTRICQSDARFENLFLTNVDFDMEIS